MAGFWHLSHHQLHDPNGGVYAGAKAYFFKSDSLLPVQTYQDYGLGTPHPNPVQANAYGMFPAVFFDEEDGFYRQRITTAGGIIIPGTDVGTIPIIGPSGGSGGSEVPVDANALFQTGDLLWMDVSGTRPGWVRDNGRTIGSATSGASERANADCEALFTFGWGKGWAVVGGAGANAAADWAANKPITLPDKRFRLAIGLDDMGNSAANRATGVPFSSGDATTAGSLGGEAVHTLTTAEIPSHKHDNTLNDPGHDHDTPGAGAIVKTGGGGLYDGGGSGGSSGSSHVNSNTTGITINNVNAGGGGSHNNVPLIVTGTFYRKL